MAWCPLEKKEEKIKDKSKDFGSQAVLQQGTGMDLDRDLEQL